MKTILVVDDEAFILMMLEDKLAPEGYRVVTRKDTRDLLEVVREERPALIFLDWMLPGMSGIEACKLLRETDVGADIPVFMLTAKGQEADEKRGYAAGVTRYLTKPFSPREILRLVEETIG